MRGGLPGPRHAAVQPASAMNEPGMDTVPLTPERIEQARQVVTRHLLRLRRPEGYWEGRLSSSALSTATAVSALAVAATAEQRRPMDDPLVARGLAWLLRDQHADGGWGDTPESPANLSTSVLALAALTLAGGTGKAHAAALQAADAYITANSEGRDLPTAVTRIYGRDRTFAVPILVNCALAGRVAWDRIPRLPYPLAAFPPAWFRHLRMQVVSYALPALIAMGLILDRRRDSGPLRRLARRWAEPRVLARLQGIQPATGGFLEAAPLTSFVVMTLVPLYGTGHPVARAGLGFIRREVREDGSWPIDSNLSVWLTSHAVKALHPVAGGSPLTDGLAPQTDLAPTRRWLQARQYTRVHPYTGSAPGGWSWTHLDGGVPDTDDTSSALIALDALGDRGNLPGGVDWLLGLQNSDGGWPTFCRGWGKLPFDRSSPDLTAHALRALATAQRAGARGTGREARMNRAIARGLRYLRRDRRPDGTWIPLWFGSQSTPDGTNPVLGTALVLIALGHVPHDASLAAQALDYLVEAQGTDGGWGARPGAVPTMEESALATAALRLHRPGSPAARLGLAYLVGRVEADTWRQSAPVGLYFASLWYDERLYPVVWTLQALYPAPLGTTP